MLSRLSCVCKPFARSEVPQGEIHERPPKRAEGAERQGEQAVGLHQREKASRLKQVSLEEQATVRERETFTVADVAVLTGFSRQTVTRIFEREQGVIVVERSESMHKRGYRSIRIPRAVYERVIGRLSVK